MGRVRQRILQALLIIPALWCATPESGTAQWVKMTQFTDRFYNEVFFADAQIGFITQHTGTVYRTSDGGDTWGTVNLPSSGFSSNRDICFVSSSVGFISGEDGIWKSTNAGVTWSDITPAGATGISSSSNWFRNANVGVWGYGSCRDTTVTFWRTTDGGATWSDTSYNHSQDVAVGGMTYIGSVFYASGGSGKFWKSTDDGATWSYSNTNSGGWQEDCVAGGSNVLIASATGTSCRSDGGSKILMSSNGGTSWNTTTFPNTVMWGISMISSTNGWSVGDFAKAYETTDGGLTWGPRTCGLKPGDRLDDVYMIDATHGFAVGDGVYRFDPDHVSPDTDTIDFGDVIIRTTRGDSLATVFAAGDNQTVQSRAIVGQHAGQFLSPDNLTSPLPIPSCGTAGTRVRFRPTTVGQKTARLTHILQSTGDTVNVVLRGNGVKPTISGDRVVSFDTLLCSTEYFDSIRIRNNGNYPLRIDSVQVANFLGFFSLVSAQFPITIQPFNVVDLAVRVRTVGSGRQSARFFVFSNDPDYADTTWNIDLSLRKETVGLPLPRDTSVTIPSAPVGTDSRLCITVPNNATVVEIIHQMQRESGSSDIQVVTSTPASFAPDDSIEICFEASADDTAARCAIFRLDTDPCDKEYRVHICFQATQGRASMPARIALAVPCDSAVETVVPISNLGNADLHIESVELLKDDLLDMQFDPAPVTPFAIEADSTRNLTVRFRGGPTGRTDEAAVVIGYEDGRTDTVVVSADVLSPEVMMPSSLTLGELCAGDTVLAWVHVENAGTYRALEVSADPIDDLVTVAIPPQPTLAVGAVDSFLVRYIAETPGDFETDVVVSSQPCSLFDTIVVSGTTLPRSMEVDSDTIRLGEIVVNRNFDTSATLLNRSAEDVVATPGVASSDPIRLDQTGNVRISSGDSTGLRFTVTPRDVGRDTSRIGIPYSGRCGGESYIVVIWEAIHEGPTMTERIDFDTLWCREPGYDTIRLENRGDEPYEIAGTDLSPRDPFHIDASVLPSVIAPNSTLVIPVQLVDAPLGRHTGRFAIYVYGAVGTDTLELDLEAFVAGAYIELLDENGLPFPDKALDVGVLYWCDREIGLDMQIRNSGNIDDTVSLTASPGAEHSVEPDGLNVSAGASRTTTLRLRPQPNFTWTDPLSIDVAVTGQLCSSRDSLTVTGTYVAISDVLPGRIDLDSLCSERSYAHSFSIENPGDREMLIDSIQYVGSNAVSIDLPSELRIASSSSATVELRILGSVAQSLDGHVAVHFAEPCHDLVEIPVTGTMVDCPRPAIELAGDSVIARWGTTIDIPVHARLANVPEMRTLGFSVRVDPTLLDVFDVNVPDGVSELFSIESLQLESTEGSVIVELAPLAQSGEDGPIIYDGPLVVLRSSVLRGSSIHSDVAIDVDTLYPSGSVSVVDGAVALADYCDAHGRLLTISGAFSLSPVQPNPASDVATIEYEVPFDGQVRLSFYDMSGTLIRDIANEWMPEGRRIVRVPLESLPSGAYVATLRAGIHERIQRFVVRK